MQPRGPVGDESKEGKQLVTATSTSDTNHQSSCIDYLQRAQERLRQKNLLRAIEDHYSAITADANYKNISIENEIASEIMLGLVNAEPNPLLGEACFRRLNLRKMDIATRTEQLVDCVMTLKHASMEIHYEASLLLAQLLADMSKEKIIEDLCNLPNAVQIEMYTHCLNTKTLLGQRFAKREGKFGATKKLLTLIEKKLAELKSAEMNKLTGGVDDFFIVESDVLPPHPQTPNKKLAVQLNNQGADLLNNNNIEPAIDLFTQATEACHIATAFYNRAKAYYLKNQFNLAYEDINACYRLPMRPSQEFDFCFLHAQILQKLGRLAEADEPLMRALAIALKAAEENPGIYEHHTKVGSVYYAMNNFVEAEKSFTLSIECESRSNLCGRYTDRAFARLRLNNLTDMLSDYHQIISLLQESRNSAAQKLHRMMLHALYEAEPNNVLAEACYHAYELHIHHGRKKEGMMDLMVACKHNPDHPTAGKKLEEIIDQLSKIEIVEIIYLQNNKLQIQLLHQCLDPTSPLGKRIWEPEGLTSCQLNEGTLKVILDRLSSLQPVLIQRGFFSTKTRKALLAHQEEKRNLPQTDHNYDGFDL